MAEIVVTPNGQEAVQVGTFIDDDGERFVGLSFEQPGSDRVLVTFTVPLFEAYVAHLNHVVSSLAEAEYWRDHITG